MVCFYLDDMFQGITKEKKGYSIFQREVGRVVVLVVLISQR
jgi:hypothetical protein